MEGEAEVSDDKMPPADHTVALTWEQIREAINAYVEHHRLVPNGAYRTRYTQVGAHEQTTIRVEFWKSHPKGIG